MIRYAAIRSHFQLIRLADKTHFMLPDHSLEVGGSSIPVIRQFSSI